jgi:DNA (cytosine-5)-methyltransferase 1
MVDAFCGAGGVSTGARMSGVCRVVAGINHDPVAIASHAANHPDTRHYIEDIRTCPLEDLVAIVREARRRYSQALVLFLASLECTQFSKAKGGKAREADSRMLAWALPRYIRALNPDLVGIENVEEFMGWGDLDDTGRPVSRLQGREYIRWVKAITALGYAHDWRMMNAADFGAYTSRERYFGVFHRPDVRHTWPTPTHARRAQRGELFSDDRKAWMPVADVLDFTNLGRSIFERGKPLVDKTLIRILKGCEKFVHQPMLMTCNTPGYCSSLEKPAGTITTRGHKAIITPVGALLPSPKTNMVTAFIVNPQYSNNGRSVLAPAPTVIASQKSNPLSLAVALHGPAKWIEQPSDSEVMRRLKAFMREHEIADIYMRMLNVSELKRIQGFPDGYILRGTQEQQKKFIGNAVVPVIVSAWMQAIANVNSYTTTP